MPRQRETAPINDDNVTRPLGGGATTSDRGPAMDLRPVLLPRRSTRRNARQVQRHEIVKNRQGMYGIIMDRYQWTEYIDKWQVFFYHHEDKTWLIAIKSNEQLLNMRHYANTEPIPAHITAVLNTLVQDPMLDLHTAPATQIDTKLGKAIDMYPIASKDARTTKKKSIKIFSPKQERWHRRIMHDVLNTSIDRIKKQRNLPTEPRRIAHGGEECKGEYTPVVDRKNDLAYHALRQTDMVKNIHRISMSEDVLELGPIPDTNGDLMKNIDAVVRPEERPRLIAAMKKECQGQRDRGMGRVFTRTQIDALGIDLSTKQVNNLRTVITQKVIDGKMDWKVRAAVAAADSVTGYEKTTSPTPSIPADNLTTAVGTWLDWHCMTFDVKKAYSNKKMPPEMAQVTYSSMAESSRTSAASKWGSLCIDTCTR